MINSLRNERVKRLAALRDRGRIRNKEGVFVAEGVKMFEEAPLDGMMEVYCGENFWRQLQEQKRYESALEKIHVCMEQGIFVEQVSEAVFERVSDTRTPQGIMFVMRQFSCGLKEMVAEAVRKREKEGKRPLFLLLEDIQDPGNLGTMIRTGEGAGVDGVIMSKGTVDVYNPKTIRSTMGSLYRVPFLYVEEIEQAVRMLQAHQISVYAAHLKGKKYFNRVSYENGSAFLIGNEGNGLTEETAELADCYLKIPMEGNLESLNAAVAAALLLYQASGYRRKE